MIIPIDFQNQNHRFSIDDVNDVITMIMAQVLDSPGAAAPEWRPGEDGIEGKRAKPQRQLKKLVSSGCPASFVILQMFLAKLAICDMYIIIFISSAIVYICYIYIIPYIIYPCVCMST